jgi:beta-lactamase regulating signal transducer with metallopeptidase domain/protocatechuate 3,4-dioxygenase beta subunit
MKTLADWYPGDAIVLGTVEVLVMLTIIVVLTWLATGVIARRRAVLAGALWLSALIVVLGLPGLALLAPQLPWRIGVVELSVGNGAPPPEHPQASPAAMPAHMDETAPVDTAASVADMPRLARTPVAESTHTAGLAEKQATVTAQRGKSASAPSAVVDQAIPVENDPRELTGDPRHASATLLLAVWAAGSMWLALQLVIGVCRIRHLERGLRPMDAEPWTAVMAEVARVMPGRRMPEVCLSRDVRSPLVAGILRQRIVLPEAFLERSTQRQVREVLLHELAHVLRGDAWVRLLERLAVILFWIHPLVHLLTRRLDEAREEVCDNHVLAHAEAPHYAETLLAVAQMCYPTPQLEGYLTMMPRHANLERRVVDLLDRRRDTATRLPWRHRLCLGGIVLMMFVGIASIGMRGAAGAVESESQQDVKSGDKAVDKAAVVGQVGGTVVHAADGSPVSGADVRLLRRGTYSGEPPTRKTTTNARGEFIFDALAPGEYRVWSFHGNLMSRSRMYRGEIVSVGPDGASKPVVLKLQPGLAVRVKVLEQADGKPIVGARVRLIWTDTDRDRFTDARGEVELTGLTAETWHIEASAKDHAAVRRILNLASEQPASLELKLSPGGFVEGRITGTDGKPIGGVGVNVYPSADDGSPLDYVETDADGRYRFDHLHLGRTLKLYAAKLDYLPLTREFHIDAGNGRRAHVDLVLSRRPHGGSVQGVVTDSDGKPVAAAEVSNHGMSSREVRRVQTDARGKFLIDDVYHDSLGHQLIVRARCFAPQKVEFEPGPAAKPAEVTVRLEPGHRIRGRVENEAGKPIAGVHVYFAHANRGSGGQFGGHTTTNAEGRFQFDSLPPDTPFTFVATGYSEIPERQLPLDGNEEVVVTLKSQGFIKGRVIDASTGKPLPRFNVRITFSPERQPDEPVGILLSHRCNPGEDFSSPTGQFALKDLLAGMPLQVTVSAPGYRRQALTRVVPQPDAEATPVEIRLAPEDPAKLVIIRGKLVDHKGQPVRGADLRLIVASDRPAQRDSYPFNWDMIESGQVEQIAGVLQMQRLTTGPDGAFVFKAVPADAEIELVYWGKGIAPNRVDHLEALSARERESMEIKAIAPARIFGAIDPKVFPAFNSIQLSGQIRFFQAKISADRKTFVIEDVLPGDFEVQVYGPAVRSRTVPDAFETPVIGRRSVTLQEGSEVRVDLGQGDRVKDDPNP